MQQQYQIQQWDDKHLNELSVSDKVHLLRVRDMEASKLTKYERLPEEPLPYESPAHALTALVVALAPPVVGIVAVGGVVYVVVSVAAMAVGAAFAFVSANAVYIGGGVFALAALVLCVGSMIGQSEDQPAQSSGGGQSSGKKEWYQRQEQGWRDI